MIMMMRMMKMVKNILTNPEHMAEFLQISENGLKQTRQQKQQLEAQLEQVNQVINSHENTINLLKNWQEIMAGDDLTLIKMAYEDIKKNMTDIKPE